MLHLASAVCFSAVFRQAEVLVYCLIYLFIFFNFFKHTVCLAVSFARLPAIKTAF